MNSSKAIIVFGLFFWLACNVNPYQEGQRLYKIHCENCHMQDGKGLRGLIPPLAKSDYLSNYKEQIPCIIRNGIQGEIIVNDTTYNTEMAGIPELSDVQINNIINYINFAWNNDLEASNVKDIKRYLKNCK